MAAKNEAKILFKAETSELTDAIQSANSEMYTLRAEMKLNEAQFQNTGDQAEYLQEKTRILEAQLEANADKQELLTQKLEAAKQIYGEDSEEVAKLERQLINAKTEEEKLKSQLDETNKGFEDQSQASEKAGESVDTMAQILASAGIADTVKEIAEAAMDMAESFDEANAAVVEGTGATGDALEDLNQQAQDAFGRIANANQDLTGMAGILAELNTRFGVTGDDAEDLTVKVANFAQHTGTDGVRAVDSMANIMKRWGLDISDADGLMDDLTTANQACQLSVDQLAGYLSNNSVQFQELGYSTEDALAMLISLSDGGANVGTIMGSLTKAVSNLSDVTDDVPGAFQDAIKAIEESGSVSEALQAQVGDTGKTVEEIFGKKAAQELAANVQNGNFAIDQWTEALENNSGALDQTTEDATTMQDAWSQASNNVSLALGQTLSPAISDAVIKVSEVISKVAQVVQDSPALQAVIIGVAVALGILAAALGISSVIQLVTTAFGALNTVLLTNPIFLVVTAIAALVAGLVYAYNNCETFRNGVNRAFSSIKSFASNAITALGNIVRNVFNAIKNNIITPVQDAYSKVTSKISDLKSKFEEKINDIKNKVSDTFQSIREKMESPIQSAKDTIDGIIGTIKGWFPLSIGNIFSNLKLPHFSLSGSFSLNPPSVPHLSVDWYAKGTVFDRATIIPTLNGLKGVGEKEPEAVSPISVLQEYVGAAVQKYVPQIDYDLLANKVAAACAKMNIHIDVDKRQLGRVVREVVTE
jgi:TP901 family phage tail tape measure protein